MKSEIWNETTYWMNEKGDLRILDPVPIGDFFVPSGCHWRMWWYGDWHGGGWFCEFVPCNVQPERNKKWLKGWEQI